MNLPHRLRKSFYPFNELSLSQIRKGQFSNRKVMGRVQTFLHPFQLALPHLTKTGVYKRMKSYEHTSLITKYFVSSKKVKSNLTKGGFPNEKENKKPRNSDSELTHRYQDSKLVL